MEFEKVLKNETNLTNEILEKKLNQIGSYKKLDDAIKYAVLSSGKRIRPILLKKTYELFEQKSEMKIVEYFMMIIELVHCYSLVHDDLPSMDNSDLRRGLPTVHKKFDEATAVLTGDALLNIAMELALNVAFESKSDLVLYAGKILFEKSGIFGMIKGQMMDLEEEEFNEKRLQTLTHLKTCDLISAAMNCGAILSGANTTQITIVENLADTIGMIFQIQDDILDYEEDKKNNKLSYAVFYGPKKANEIKENYRTEAFRLLKKLNKKSDFFEAFVDFLCDRVN